MPTCGCRCLVLSLAVVWLVKGAAVLVGLVLLAKYSACDPLATQRIQVQQMNEHRTISCIMEAEDISPNTYS